MGMYEVTEFPCDQVLTFAYLQDVQYHFMRSPSSSPHIGHLIAFALNPHLD